MKSIHPPPAHSASMPESATGASWSVLVPRAKQRWPCATSVVHLQIHRASPVGHSGAACATRYAIKHGHSSVPVEDAGFVEIIDVRDVLNASGDVFAAKVVHHLLSTRYNRASASDGYSETAPGDMDAVPV